MGPPLIHLDAATGSAVASRCAAVSTSRYNGLTGSASAVAGRAPTSSDPATSSAAVRLRLIGPSCLRCPGDSAEDLDHRCQLRPGRGHGPGIRRQGPRPRAVRPSPRPPRRAQGRADRAAPRHHRRRRRTRRQRPRAGAEGVRRAGRPAGRHRPHHRQRRHRQGRAAGLRQAVGQQADHRDQPGRRAGADRNRRRDVQELRRRAPRADLVGAGQQGCARRQGRLRREQGRACRRWANRCAPSTRTARSR